MRKVRWSMTENSLEDDVRRCNEWSFKSVTKAIGICDAVIEIKLIPVAAYRLACPMRWYNAKNLGPCTFKCNNNKLFDDYWKCC